MTREKLIVRIFLFAAVAAMAMQAIAQQPVVQSLAVIERWQSKGTASGGFTQIISPDGTTQVHLGPRENEDGLYIKNRSTGQDTQIVENAGNYKEFDSLSFSNDGSLIAFRACPPLGAACNWSKVFIVHADGTGLTEVADSFSDVKTDIHYTVGMPLFSADGSKVLIMLTALEMVELEDVGKRRLPMSHFVGIVPADGSSKTPEKLVPGNALFWSQDGMAFYYMGPEGFARYDVLSKASTLITLPQGYSRIFGEVQTEDVVFVQNTQTFHIGAFNLSTGAADDKMQQVAASILPRDAQNRPLQSIESAGPHRLLLRYGTNHPAVGVAKQNNEIVSF